MVDDTSHTRPLPTSGCAEPIPVTVPPPSASGPGPLSALSDRAEFDPFGPRHEAEVLFRLLHEQSLEQRRRLLETHDRFTSLLMAESRRHLAVLESWFIASRRPGKPGGEGAQASLVEEVFHLRERLSAALAEVDETRTDAARLQDERDAAIRETQDVRAEYQRLLGAMEDHTARLTLELEELQRTLTDVRDQAREETQRDQEYIRTLEAELRQLRPPSIRPEERRGAARPRRIEPAPVHENLRGHEEKSPTRNLESLGASHDPRAGSDSSDSEAPLDQEVSRITNSSVVELRPKPRASRA